MYDSLDTQIRTHLCSSIARQFWWMQACLRVHEELQEMQAYM